MASVQIIKDDLKEAMKKKEATRVLVFRMLLAGLSNLSINKKSELDQAEIDKFLKKEVKKRLDSIEMYIKGSRADLADKEKIELQIIKEYLPEEMDEKEVSEIVLKLKSEGNLGSDFGQAMRSVMAKTAGKADGKIVAKVVRENL